ncbi:hypothetical protein ACIQFU_37135 [Streptomyces sp. NPDC093065]|uniref:hypothetical protein n=1 Tax=Streptomyces sp. NPDC093065 TaxID=3366021 RepID=UPI00382EEE5B
MNVLLPAVFGLLGAAVGAIAAIWGAKRTADAAIEQVFHQHEFERERWRKEQRQQAYVAYLEAVDVLKTLVESLAVRVDTGRSIDVQEWVQMDDADVALMRAADRITLTGPQRVAAAASELSTAYSDICSALLPAEGRSAEIRYAEYRERERARHPAYVDFRREAQVALGFEDPPSR